MLYRPWLLAPSAAVQGTAHSLGSMGRSDPGYTAADIERLCSAGGFEKAQWLLKRGAVKLKECLDSIE